MTLTVTTIPAYFRQPDVQAITRAHETELFEAALRKAVTPERFQAAFYGQPVAPRPAPRRFRRERIHRSRLTGHALMLLALAVYPGGWRA